MNDVIKTGRIGIVGLGVLAAGLLGVALWRDDAGEPAGWVAVNRQLDTALEASGGVAANGKKGAAADAAADATAAAAPAAALPGTPSRVADSPQGGGNSGGTLDRPSPADTPAPSDRQSAAEGKIDINRATAAADTPPPSDRQSAAGKIDINRATAEELDALPGIGPAKAKAIVDDRTRNGRFRSADDLARVKGIGPKMAAKLKSDIVAGP